VNIHHEQKKKQIHIAGGQTQSFDFLSQLNDKKTGKAHIFAKNVSDISETTHHSRNSLDYLGKSSFQPEDSLHKMNHLDILIAASEKLVDEGVLEDVERTINSRTISNETSDNSNDLSESYMLSKKTERKPKNFICQNEGCELKGQKVSKVYTVSDVGKKLPFDHLCKKCFQAFKDRQFCYYCYFVYTTETNDNRSWVQCDSCCLWHHVACEETNGKYKNLIVKSNQKYKCPHCRKSVKRKRNTETADIYCRSFNYNLSRTLKTGTEQMKLPLREAKKNSIDHLSLLSSDSKGLYNDLMKIKY